MIRRKFCRLPAALTALCMLAFNTNAIFATTLIDEAHVVVANDGVAATIPAAKSFSITAAGDYNITLIDVGKQANSADVFVSLSMVIYQNSKLIKLVSVPEATASSKTDKVTLTPGVYSAQVLGVTSGASLYSMDISNANASALSMAGVINKAGSTNGNDFSSLQPELSLVAGHTYGIAAHDIAFPSALDSLQVAMVTDGLNVQCQLTSTTPGPCNFVAGTTNKLVAVAKKSAAAVAGMYTIKIVDNTSNQVVMANIYPVGAMPDPVTVQLPADGTYQLITTDMKSPDPLNSLQALLLQDIDVLTTQNAAPTSQTSTFNANAGAAKLYVVGNSTANGGIYGVQLAEVGGANDVIYSNASAISVDGATTQTGYFFNARLPSAGSYVLNLNDLNFPQTFKNLSLAVTQGSTIVGKLNASGMLTLNNMSAGDVQINVIATPNSAGQGLFGVTLTASGSTAMLLDVTQGVGGTFESIPLNVMNAGSYRLSVNDMQAPQRLGQLLVAVTRDAQFIGEVIGGGVVDVDATPGSYALNVIATTDTAANAPLGMYGIAFGSAPSVTFSSSAGSVSPGGSVFLNWSSSDVTSCVASDGWSGNKAVTGSESLGPISADVKLTLTCAGATGSVSKSISVQVTANPDPPAAKKGGGGAMQWWMLLMLLAVSYQSSQRRLSRHR